MPAGAGQDSERFAAAVEYGESVVPPSDEQLLSELEVVALLRASRASLAPTADESARMRARVMAAAASMLPAPNAERADSADATPSFDEAPTVVGGPAISDDEPTETERTAVLDETDPNRGNSSESNVVGIGTARGRHRFPTSKAPSARRRGLLGISAAAALLVFAVTGGGAMFSQSALPGDSLYGVKQAAESAIVGLTPGQGNKAQRQLDYAATRLNEIQQLDAGQDAATSDRAADVSQALRGFNEQTAAGSRMWLTSAGTKNPAELGALANWAQSQSQRLSQLRSGMPSAAQPDAEHSQRLLEDLRTRAQSLINRQGCDRITSTESDQLGPLPAKGPCTSKESTSTPSNHPVLPSTLPAPARKSGSGRSSDSESPAESSDAPTSSTKSGKSKQNEGPSLPGLGDLTGGSEVGRLPTKDPVKTTELPSTSETPKPGLNLPLLLPILLQPLSKG